MRLIDADELKKALAEMWYENNIRITGLSVAELIDEAPTINGVLSVVRCKDCKYYTEKSIEKKYGWCNEKELLVDETEFCSWGEKGETMDIDIEYDVEYLPDKDGIQQAKATITKAEPSGDVNKVQTSAEQRKCGTCQWYKGCEAFDPHNGTCKYTEPSGDLISREDAIEAIARYDETDGTYRVFTGRDVIDILHTLPSANRPKGEWIKNDALGWKCSRCGIITNLNTHYCPSCGADMRKDQDR